MTSTEAPEQWIPNGHRLDVVIDETDGAAISFEQLQVENRQLRAQLDDLTDAWEGVRAEVGEECAVRERLQAGLQAAQAEAEAERRGRLAAERRAEAAEAEAQKGAAAAAALTERCERAVHERAELRTGTAELKARLEATVRDLEKCRAENASLSHQLQTKPPLSPPLQPSDAGDDDSGRLLKHDTQPQQKVLRNSIKIPEPTANRPSQPVNPDRRQTKRGGKPSTRRFSVAVDSGNNFFNPDDDAILQGGSALLVRLHRLERENSALRRRLGIPDDSALPDNVFYGRSHSPDRPVVSPASQSTFRNPDHRRRLDVEQWTSRHAQLKRLLEQRFGSP